MYAVGLFSKSGIMLELKHNLKGRKEMMQSFCKDCNNDKVVQSVNKLIFKPVKLY